MFLQYKLEKESIINKIVQKRYYVCRAPGRHTCRDPRQLSLAPASAVLAASGARAQACQLQGTPKNWTEVGGKKPRSAHPESFLSANYSTNLTLSKPC